MITLRKLALRIVVKNLKLILNSTNKNKHKLTINLKNTHKKKQFILFSALAIDTSHPDICLNL